MDYQTASKLFSYDPEAGDLIWRTPTSNAVKAGDVAGSVNSLGYKVVQVGGKLRRAHRIAWLLTHGEYPPFGLDHIDGDKANNRISNLRPATQAENLQNTKINRRNKSGYPGVSWFKAARRWRARITVDRKDHHLGYFNTPEEAAAARKVAKARLHTFQPTDRANA